METLKNNLSNMAKRFGSAFSHSSFWRYVTEVSWKHYFGIDTSANGTYSLMWPVKTMRYDWTREEMEYLRMTKSQL